jgi:hypothetical protein
MFRRAEPRLLGHVVVKSAIEGPVLRQAVDLSVGNLKRRTILGPRLPVIIKACGRDVRMA